MTGVHHSKRPAVQGLLARCNVTKRLLLILLLPVLAAGCALKGRAPGSFSSYDYSDYETYDQPHGASPSWAGGQ